MAIILHLLVALLPACWATSPIEELFWKVGENDDFYSTEYHRDQKSDNLILNAANLVFGDWSVTVKFNMGKRYRRPIPKLEATTLKQIFESLNQSHYHSSAVNTVNGRVCNISINGEQMVRNFIREYRTEIGEVEYMKDLVAVKFDLYGVKIGLFFFQMFNKTREGVFKFLPYRIKDLTDLYRFTNKPASPTLFFRKYEFDVTEGCLQLQDAALNLLKQTNITGNCWNETSEYHVCLGVEYHMETSVNHMFMFALAHIDTWYRMMQSGFFKMHREVCALTLNRDTSNLNKLYKPYTIYECCSTSKAHVHPYEEHSDNRLYCHRPYQVTEILAIISLFFGYFTMAVFPLAIKWIPSQQSTAHPNVRLVFHSP